MTHDLQNNKPGSLSVHSISWNYSLFAPELKLNSNNKIEICCREFGNDLETFNDFYTKLQYLITWTVQKNVFDEYILNIKIW